MKFTPTLAYLFQPQYVNHIQLNLLVAFLILVGLPLTLNFTVCGLSVINYTFMLLLLLPLVFIGWLIILQMPGFRALNQEALPLQRHERLAKVKASLINFMFLYTGLYFLLCYYFFTLEPIVGSYLGCEPRGGYYPDRVAAFNLATLLPTLFQMDNSFVQWLQEVTPPLTFLFYIDVVGLLFMGLSGFLIFLCIFFLWPTFELEKNMVLYVSQLILLLTQLQLTFTAVNLLTFFVAFESLLIPMILMISIWGSPNRRQANNYLVFYTMVSAVPLLLALIYIQQHYGSLNLTVLVQVDSWTWSEQFWLWLAFFFAFAVKTPMVPVHIWLPKAHVDAPTAGSVILAGLLLKVGLVGFIRVLLPVFPEATHFFAPYVAALATVGVLYASLITLRQIDMKRIIAYSSVAHMNMALVSLCSLNPIGLYSSLYLMLSHGLIASGLFFLVGFLYNRFHVRTVAYFGGLAIIMPVMTIMFFMFSLANMAFPFTSGFVGEFLLLLGISSTNFFLGFLNSVSMLLTTVYTLLLFGRVFLGQLKPQFETLVMPEASHANVWKYGTLYDKLQTIRVPAPQAKVFMTRFSHYDLYYYEFIIVSLLLAGILFLGIYPQALLSLLVKSPNLQLVIAAF